MSNEFYSIAELVNPTTMGLLRWYVERKLPSALRDAATKGAGDSEDLIQEAALILCRSKMSRKLAVSTYCTNAVRYAALSMAERASKMPRNAQNEFDETYGPERHDVGFGNIDDAECIAIRMLRLNETEMDVVKRYFGLGVACGTLRDVASAVGRSVQGVKNIRDAAIRKMAEA